MEDLNELIAMADMYASSCTAQYEKFSVFQRAGCVWEWKDCKAAFQLIYELPNWFPLVRAWQKEHICRSCGFPNEYHSYGCEIGGDY